MFKAPLPAELIIHLCTLNDEFAIHLPIDKLLSLREGFIVAGGDSSLPLLLSHLYSFIFHKITKSWQTPVTKAFFPKAANLASSEVALGNERNIYLRHGCVYHDQE